MAGMITEEFSVFVDGAPSAVLGVDGKIPIVQAGVTHSIPASSFAAGALNGDVIGPFLSNTVNRIQGQTVNGTTGHDMVVFSSDPVLTGVPIAPTAAPGTNTGQIATTGFVAAVATSGQSALAAETAARQAADTTLQTNITNEASARAAADALLAPIASPVFTGDPRAPTPLPSDNDTSVATTAFVKSVTPLPAVPTALAGDVAIPGVATTFMRSDGAPAVQKASSAAFGIAKVDGTTILATGGVISAASAASGITQLTNDVLAGPGSGSQVATLVTVNPNVGTFQGLTVDAKGRVTAATNQNYLTTALAASTYAPIASPVFAGNPTAPTPTAGDNDTSIATTAFVQSAVAAAGVTVSDTPPGSPVVGRAWWDSTSGQLFVWYSDGSSAQWVPATNMPGPPGATGPQGIQGLVGPTGPTGPSGTSGPWTVGSIPFANSTSSLTQDNPNLFWDDGNNRLGVGTAAPFTVLHTNKAMTGGLPAASGTADPNVAARIQGSSVAFDIGVEADGDVWLQPRSAANLASNFNLNLNPNGGNVGIGTTGPATKLHVNGAPGQLLSLDVNSAANRRASLAFTQQGAQRWELGADNYVNNTQTFYLYDNVASLVRLLVDASGNIGIGTTGPGSKLHVVGPDGVIGIVAGVTKAVRVATGPSGSTVEGVDNTGFGSFQPLGVGGSFLYLHNSGTEVMRVTGNNVGIGTTGPASKLHVDNGYTTIGRYSASGALVLQTAAGTQGSPTAQAANTNTGTIFFRGYDGTAYRDVAQIAVWTDNAVITSTSSPGFIAFNTTPTGAVSVSERMRIDSAGNVGIGTTAPVSRLTVANAVDTDQQVFVRGPTRGVRIGSNATGGSIDAVDAGITAVQPFFVSGNPLNLFAGGLGITVLSGGNVGIGMTGPVYKLEVMGSTFKYLAANPTTVAAATQLLIGEASHTAGYNMAIGYGPIAAGSWSGVLQVNAAGSPWPLLLNPSGGTVGVGILSPFGKLHVGGFSANTSNINTSTQISNALVLDDVNGTGGSGGTVLFTAAGATYRFASIHGYLTNGASNSQGNLDFAIRYQPTDATLTTMLSITPTGFIISNWVYPNGNNTIQLGASGSAFSQVVSYAFTNASDPLVKTDIQAAPEGALDKVMDIEPKTFRWREGTETALRHRGFLTTDVRRVMGPDFAGVVHDDESGLDGLQYHEMTAVLWQAVRELRAEVAALRGAA